MALDFWCPSTAQATGYGRVHFCLYRALKKLGAKLTDDPGAGDITVFYGQPGIEAPLRKLWRVRTKAKFLFYCMFECSVPPKGWVDVLEGRLPGVQPVDGLLVPSTWCGEMFRENGVTCPIHVVPHGIGPEEFPILERDPERPFTFLWQGVVPNDRKGAWLVREAFESLGYVDTRLVLKWWNQQSPRGFYWKDNDKRIEHIGLKLSDPDMLNLLRRCDCSVNPTSGEGFGLIPLEHAATGMATMVTNWSGPADYATHVGMWCLTPIMKPSVFGGQIGLDAVDATVSLHEMRGNMAWCAENRESALKMGRNVAERIHKSWTWRHAAERLIAACATHVPRETIMGAQDAQ